MPVICNLLIAGKLPNDRIIDMKVFDCDGIGTSISYNNSMVKNSFLY